MVVFPFAALFLRDLLIRGLGLPPEMVGGLLLLSLFGSFVNIPLAELKAASGEEVARATTRNAERFFRI